MSPVSTMVKAIAVASFLGQAAAHIVMANPQPFSAEYMATSPLASDGSNFPCQYTGPSSYTFNHMNNMAVGEDQLLSFNGSASHGGGTCQLAVTLDTAPTKSSVWKNIMVLEGGCPVVGNGNDGTKTFKFQIPSGFPNGKATFSWVWNNRIGNREIYMSCAPITVSGGSDSGKDFYNSLPDLYVVNMPPEECTVAENGNLIIPNPGKNVIRDTSAPGSFISATGPKCAAAKAYSGGDAAPGNTAGAGTTAVTTTAATQPTQYAPAPTGGNTAAAGNKGVESPTGLITIITKTTGGATGGATSAPTTTAAGSDSGSGSNSNSNSDSDSDSASGSNTNAGSSSGGSSSGGSTSPPASGPPSYSPPAANPPASSPPSSGSAATGGSCTSANDGQIVCNGTGQFGLCNHGGVVWQSVAAGTQCVGGKVLKKREDGVEEEVAVVAKREPRHPHWGGRRF